MLYFHFYLIIQSGIQEWLLSYILAFLYCFVHELIDYLLMKSM